MSWCPPGAFIGEFDSFVGPSVAYAFEYYAFKKNAGANTRFRNFRYLSSKVTLGEKVASGRLHWSYTDYMRSVASRILTSNEDQGENIIFQDFGCPCVGGTCFSLPDILARGEKRSFCLVFVHSSYNKMLSQWPLIATCSHIFMHDYCFEVATKRYTTEYSTLPDLEQSREEARSKSLRPFEELVRRENEDLCATLTRIHCFFEIMLPLIFGSHPLFDFPGSQLTRDVSNVLSEKVASIFEQAVPQVALRLTLLDLKAEDEQEKMKVWMQQPLSLQTVMRPLSVWLLQYLSGASPDQEGQLHVLLNALFAGDQIIIFGDDAYSSAALALAMSYMLPQGLVRIRIFSNSYVMPYEGQIVSFDYQFLSEWEILPFRNNLHATNEKEFFILSEIEADRVVGVQIREGRINMIFDCDKLAENLKRAPLGPSRYHNTHASHHRTTTLTCRIMGLLHTHIANTSTHLSSNSVQHTEVEIGLIKLLNAQMMQLVSEYALRGSVYSKLFRQQEIRANKELFQRGTSTRDASFLTKFYQPLKRVLVPNGPCQPAPETSRGDNSTPSTSVLQKKTLLFTEANKGYGVRQFLFLSSVPEDHDVLLFLGSRASDSGE